jgi:hypothetical protein
MKWLVVLSLCVVGCGNDAPPVIPGSDTPLSPGNIDGTGGAGGGAGGGGGTGGEDGSIGACDNEADLGVIEGMDSSLRDVARDCGLPNNVFSLCANLIFNGQQYEECIAECIEEEVPGLSTECVACYGALERCGVAQIPSCRTQCQLNTCSTLCLDCLNRVDCISDFEECRGLPGDGCPAPSP